jgi:DNA-binding transcriptional MerR regulator
MNRLITIGEQPEMLGVPISALHKWDRQEMLTPEKTTSGHRRYDISKLKPEMCREHIAQTRKKQ